MTETPAKLYVIRGSHACRAAILTLDFKGVDYTLVTLPTGPHPMLVRMRGFRAEEVRELPGTKRTGNLKMADRFGTVPALRYGDERVQTNRAISRFLDGVRSDPPLFPADPQLRSQVEDAEAFGNQVLQMTARRVLMATNHRGPDAIHRRGSAGRLGPLLTRSDLLRRLETRYFAARVFAATRETEAELLEALPVELDRVDGWVEDGVLNGPQLNAADFMIAPSLALLGYRNDLRSSLEARPSWALVDRLLPEPA
jgi:glutathione S-transferase